LPTPGITECGRCMQHRPSYDAVIAALEYAAPVDYLVTDLKYRRNLAGARTLGFMLAAAIEAEPYPDIVLPMPMAPSRLRERGFNQAAEIARYICSQYGLSASHNIARRNVAGAPLASLPWRERARNIRGAFECKADLSGKTIAVVDDVLTTGSTLEELASVLKHAGARRVTGWIAARTPSRR